MVAQGISPRDLGFENSRSSQTDALIYVQNIRKMKPLGYRLYPHLHVHNIPFIHLAAGLFLRFHAAANGGLDVSINGFTCCRGCRFNFLIFLILDIERDAVDVGCGVFQRGFFTCFSICHGSLPQTSV